MAGVRRGVFTCVGWQLTLCDTIWQVTSGSSEVGIPRKSYIGLLLSLEPRLQLLNGLDSFDHYGMGIVASSDIQRRFFKQCLYQLLESKGYTPAELRPETFSAYAPNFFRLTAYQLSLSKTSNRLESK